MTSAPGMSMVLIRPPSLDPSTPDVREPKEWTISGDLGYRLAGCERCENDLDRRLVAEPAGVQDHVVVGRVDAVVAVDLADVGGPVLISLLQPPPRLVLGPDAEALHDRLHPYRLCGAEEDVEGAGSVAQQVGAAATDDDDVPAPRRLLDHVLGDLEHGLAGVERGGGVGRCPGGGRLRRDERLRARAAEGDQEPGEQRPGLLVLGLDLLLRQLEAAGDLVG